MKFCIVKHKEGETQYSTNFEGLKEGEPVVVETDRNGYPSLLKGKFVKYVEGTNTPVNDLKPVVGRWLETGQ